MRVTQGGKETTELAGTRGSKDTRKQGLGENKGNTR